LSWWIRTSLINICWLRDLSLLGPNRRGLREDKVYLIL
jgi:hypothetical protein